MANPRKKFSKIFNQCIDKIYRFIFLKVNSQEIAQDLTSETFLKGWESFKQNKDSNPSGPSRRRGRRAPIENPQAFLYQIARNLVTDYYREKGRTQIVSAEYTPIVDPRENLEEKAILNSDLDTIRLAVANLKEDYQNVIIWYYLDDLPLREIAKMLKRSEATTRVLLHRALKALKNELK